MPRDGRCTSSEERRKRRPVCSRYVVTTTVLNKKRASLTLLKYRSPSFKVPCEGSSLRSIGCFLLISAKESSIVVWHGASAPEHIQKMAKGLAEKLSLKPPQEMKFTQPNSVRTSEVVEGSESREVRDALDLRANAYLERNPAPKTSPRMFYMSSVSGKFEVKESLCPFRRVDVLNTMPFNQADLYVAEQPGKNLEKKDARTETRHAFWGPLTWIQMIENDVQASHLTFFFSSPLLH